MKQNPRFGNLILNQKGQGLTEYLILVILISIISIVAVRGLGGVIESKIQMVTRQIRTNVDLGQ